MAVRGGVDENGLEALRLTSKVEKSKTGEREDLWRRSMTG